MNALTIYAIKSSIVLCLLYLPYTLLLKKETFFRLNRTMLLLILIASLIVPCIDIPSLMPSSPVGEAISNVVILPTLVVGALSETSSTGSSHPSTLGLDWVVTIYIIGMLLCLVWKIVGLVRLVRFIPSGCLWTDRRSEATIYCHAGQVSPFSWMRSVVLGEADVSIPSDAHSPILTHELAHVRMLHSWDTLLVSLAEALQWFNPLIWMLDASLREVHEYEADDAVLRRGISARDYQLLLIEKAVGRNCFTFANSFNHSLLKNRITMMTKKKSPSWARLKVLYAVPLTLIALAAFASHEVKETIESPIAPKAKSVTKQQTKTLKAVEENTIISDGNVPQVVVPHDENRHLAFKEESTIIVDGKEITKEVASQLTTGDIAHVEVLRSEAARKIFGENTKPTVVVITTKDGEIFDKPEVLPEFPGGQGEMMKWMSQNIRYPKVAQEWGVQARVLVEFVVEKDGSISNVKTIKTTGTDQNSDLATVATAYKDMTEQERKEAAAQDEGLKAGKQALLDEAIRVVNAMPNWNPGRDKGKPVRTKFVLPVMFRLN